MYHRFGITLQLALL